MKVMILSDSHSMRKHELLELLKKNECDYYIHCGDIYPLYEQLPINHFYVVRGNNDYNNTPNELTITIDNKIFFVTHGHRYYIDYSIDELIEVGKEINADVICYGHTHRPLLEEIDGMMVINPGSVTYPRGRYRKPTYCILDTNNMNVVFYDVTTLQPCNPF